MRLGGRASLTSVATVLQRLRAQRVHSWALWTLAISSARAGCKELHCSHAPQRMNPVRATHRNQCSVEKRAKQVGRSQVASIAGIADQCWSPSSCHPASHNVMTFMWLAHTCFNSLLYFFVSLIVLKVEILYLEIKSGVTCNDSCKVQTYLFTVLFKVFHGVPLWLLPTETPHWRTPSLNMAPKASEQSLLSLRWVVLVQFRGAGRKIAQPAQCGIDSSPPHQLSSYKLTNWRRQTIPLRLSASWKLCKFQTPVSIWTSEHFCFCHVRAGPHCCENGAFNLSSCCIETSCLAWAELRSRGGYCNYLDLERFFFSTNPATMKHKQLSHNFLLCVEWSRC